MSHKIHEYRVFLREFRRHFETTGSVLPSSQFLAAALARYVSGGNGPRRILEVGPGTGAVTQKIVRALGPEDRFDLVELNDAFVRRLRKRFRREPEFQRVAPQCQVLHQSVEELAGGQPYDLIISGLPLNNFSVGLVEKLLSVLTSLLSPTGTLSFFQYIAIRPARAMVSGAAERRRLKGIGELLRALLSAGEIRREWILPNIPPAYVHHVRLSGGDWLKGATPVEGK